MQLSDVLEVYLLLLLQILIDIDNVAVDLLGESVARLGIQLETLINGISDVFLVFTQHVYDLTLLQLFVLSILVQQVFGNLGDVHDLVHKVTLLITVSLHLYNQLLSRFGCYINKYIAIGMSDFEFDEEIFESDLDLPELSDNKVKEPLKDKTNI